jgi:hypothetical protein
MAQAFLRPIEVTSGGMTVNYDGGGAHAQNLTEGVYPSILSLVHQLDNQLDDENAALSAYISTAWKVTLASSGAAAVVVLTSEDVAAALGFTSLTINIPAAGSVAATYTPEYCWLPTWQSADREYWRRHQGDATRGSIAANGRFVGVSSGPTLYSRSLSFQFETALLTYRSAETTSFTITSTFYPNQRRSFEHFMEQCRAAMPITGGAPTTKGFYYLPNRSVYTGASPIVALPSTMDDGGVKFDLSSSPDRYVYCHASSDGADDPHPALPNNRDYYSISFVAHTAAAPTWTAP